MSTRLDVDVSHLESVQFGSRNLVFWATIGFIVIEGFTLLLMVASYLYLRLNQLEWPPPPTPDPDLLVPTINLALLLLIMWPMRKVELAAKAFDRERVTRWLTVATVLTIPAVVLRWFELDALNVRWDSNAYASAAWGIVVLHATLILVDLFETGALALLFGLRHAQKKHFTDAADAALYQYYLSLAWLPLYLLVYWGPRVL